MPSSELEAELDARRKEREIERAEKERIEAADKEACLASVHALNTEIEDASAEAEAAGWTESAKDAFHARVDAAQSDHREIMAGLTVGC